MESWFVGRKLWAGLMLLRWLLLRLKLFCWQVKADFKQVNKILVTLLTLNKSNTLSQAAFGYLLFTPCQVIGHKVLPTHPLPRVLWIWGSVFYSQAFFTLHSFLLVLRLPWRQQFNLKVSRASCWSSKHSPSQAIASNDSNAQKKYGSRFYLCA